MKRGSFRRDGARDGERGFAESCVELLEANGHGETVEQSHVDLRTALRDVMEYRGKEAGELPGQGERLKEVTA